MVSNMLSINTSSFLSKTVTGPAIFRSLRIGKLQYGYSDMVCVLKHTVGITRVKCKGGDQQPRNYYSVMLVNLPIDLVGKRALPVLCRKIGEAVRKVAHWLRFCARSIRSWKARDSDR